MPKPDISIVIPARNEGSRLVPTIRSIARTRITDARLEFVIMDDASTDDTIANLVASVPELLNEPRIDIIVYRSDKQRGIYGARNLAAEMATADILFGTDGHVRFSRGWDEMVFRHIAPDRILAGVTTQRGSHFRGYGCRLLVPFMEAKWNCEPVHDVEPVPIVAEHATVITRQLFRRLEGYDPGMIVYGGGEGEFSVRAWLQGAEIMVVEDLKVEHHFKPKAELAKFIRNVEPFWVHNCLRFGLLYLSELGCLQLLRFYSQSFPEIFQEALRRVEASDVWERRNYLESQQQRTFEWFVNYFGIKNQIGGEII